MEPCCHGGEIWGRAKVKRWGCSLYLVKDFIFRFIPSEVNATSSMANVRLCNRKSSLLAREAPEDGMIQNSKIFQPHSLDSIPHIVVRISILLPTYVDVDGVYANASVHDMCLCLHFANEMVFATRQTILMIIIPSSNIKSSLAPERHPWSMWLPLPMTRAV